MRKVFNLCVSVLVIAVVVFAATACDNLSSKECQTAESVELSSVVLAEVEFKNSEGVKLEQSCDEIEVSGRIDAMTNAQKSVYGVQDVSHVVCVKITFDKERTISSFKMEGSVVKVYSTNNADENYAGSLTDLLDNESGEDAFTNIILSANTKQYKLTIKYTDGYESVLDVEIKATLATAESE